MTFDQQFRLLSFELFKMSMRHCSTIETIDTVSEIGKDRMNFVD